MALLALAIVPCVGRPQSAGEAAEVARLVKAVETRYRSAVTLQVVFLESYREGGKETRVESGAAFFRRPGRMRWEYEQPEKKLFLVDGKQVWFYVPADRTVTRTRIQQSDDWRTPLALLAGKGSLARACKRIVRDSAPPGSASSSREAVLLRCVPRDKDAGFKEIILGVNPANYFSRIVIREPGGIETEFNFTKWESNRPLPEAMFHFQAPAGVAIVEGGGPGAHGPGRLSED